MLKKIWVTNLILLLFAFFFIFKVFDVWNEDITEPNGTFQKKKAGRTDSLPAITKKRVPPSAYRAIAQKSLFSPDRSASITEKRSETPADTVAPTHLKGKVTLFGIIIEDKKRSALIKAPVKTEDEKPVRWAREGDRIAHYTLSNIESDKIILTDGKQNYRVELYGADKLKDQPAHASKKLGKDGNPTVITAKKNPSQTPSGTSKSTITPDGKYKIVETPFGKSRIRIKK